MRPSDSLKEIERRAYRSTFNDGIYDIAFGLAFLIVAWIPALGSFGIAPSLGYLIGVLLIPACVIAKRLITIPRLGSVAFGPKRKTKRKLLLILSLAIVFLVFPLLIMSAELGFPGGMGGNLAIPAAVGTIVALLFALAGYFLDYLRLYIYAAILVAAYPHAGFLYQYTGAPLDSLVSLGAPGVIVLIYGIALLSRFVRKYPRPTVEVPDAV